MKNTLPFQQLLSSIHLIGVVVGLGLITGAHLFSNNTQAALDVQIHGSYYVLSHYHLIVFLGIFIVSKNLLITLFGGEMRFKKWMLFHLIVDAIAILIFLYYILFVPISGAPRRYYQFGELAAPSKAPHIPVIPIVSTFFALNQVLVLVLLGINLLMRKTMNSNSNVLDEQ